MAVGGRDLSQWTFDSNNVLAWGDEAGYTAWLQFTVLPGGPVFMGTLHPSGEADGAGERPPPPSPSHCPLGDARLGNLGGSAEAACTDAVSKGTAGLTSSDSQ